MPLHPQVAAFLQQLQRQQIPPLDELPLDVTRRALIVGSAAGPNAPRLQSIENRKILRSDGTAVPIRVYVPEGTGPFGACLYFHGGGWVLNNVDTHDDLVRRLAAASGCVLISVDYRLAPEHPYPAAIEDAYTSLIWLHEHAAEIECDPNRIAVAGDSAGGNLAAVLCLMSRDRKGPAIAFQVLIYPITDCDCDRPSYRENGEGYFLTRREMQWFWDHYISDPLKRVDPYASPIRAASLCQLPPALIQTAEFDPLRDEGEAYAKALRDAGVEATLHRFDGMIHAFMKRVQQFDMALVGIEQIGQALRQRIGQ